jgi:hypothetical protein
VIAVSFADIAELVRPFDRLEADHDHTGRTLSSHVFAIQQWWPRYPEAER